MTRNTNTNGPTLSKNPQSAFKRHFSQGSASNQDDSKNLSQIKSAAHAVFGPNTPKEKLIERLELLEHRIMAPPPQDIRKNSGESSLGMHSNAVRSINFGGGSHHGPSQLTLPQEGSMAETVANQQNSGSQHSFSFGASGTPTHRNSASPSIQYLDKITESHLEKVRGTLSVPPPDSDKSAGASFLSASATNRSSHSISSNQTLITAHVKLRAKSMDVIVAESPPVASEEKNESNHTASKAVRALNSTTDDGDKSITPSSSSKRKSSIPAKFQDVSADRKRRKNIPKKTSSVSDETKSTNPISPMQSSQAHMELNSTSSRGASNPGKAKSKEGYSSETQLKPPPANMLITNFFRTSGGATKIDVDTKCPPQSNDDHKEKVTKEKHPSLENELRKQIDELKATITNLTESLEEKSSQLKAVSNNQTIVHAQLRAQLQQREKELSSLKEEIVIRESRKDQVIEDFIRKEAIRESVELRQKLASDGARLGRWVSTRVGMRVEPIWEDGHAYLKLKKRRQELKMRRVQLEERSKSKPNLTSNEDRDFETLEREEFEASLRLHWSELEREEEDYRKEEEALVAEKNTHKMALKQIANEDSSRFSQRPKLHNRYVLMSQLGRGGFSEVWRAYDLEELREVAVKIHQLDTRWSEARIENYTKHVAREYEIHREVRHPRIVTLHDVFEIDDNSFATVLECCEGTDLDTLLKERKKLPEDHARAILLQILSGMKYLSTPSSDGKRQGIIHYDLKPGNILFDGNGDAKITDFGLSKIMDSEDPGDSMELTSQGAGTYWYLPPECFITTASVRITNKVDVWSIGVIFYQMLYGKRPFGDGQSQECVLTNNVMLNAREVQFPDDPAISQGAKDFICQCLTYEQALRPNIAELCKSPYTKGVHNY